MKIRLIFLSTLLSVLLACEKQPGEGGTSSISGTLLLYQFNDNYTQRINADLLPAQDVDIYIQYGDNKTIQDKVETSPEGYFEFNNLYEGDYTIIYYSEDINTASRQKEALVINVNLNKNDSKDLGNLNYIKSLDYNDGLAQITACVKEVSFTYNSIWPNMIPTDTLLVLDRAVFIRPLHHKTYTERVRTQGDGTFCFKNLIPGKYEIFVFSDDIKGSNQDVSIKDTVQIETNTATTYEMDDIIIYNM